MSNPLSYRPPEPKQTPRKKAVATALVNPWAWWDAPFVRDITKTRRGFAERRAFSTLLLYIASADTKRMEISHLTPYTMTIHLFDAAGSEVFYTCSIERGETQEQRRMLRDALQTHPAALKPYERNKYRRHVEVLYGLEA